MTKSSGPPKKMKTLEYPDTPEKQFVDGWRERSLKGKAEVKTKPFDPVDPNEVRSGDTEGQEYIEEGRLDFSDALFFEWLEQTPQFLATNIFQEKIKMWQDMVRDSTLEESYRFEARDRLYKIGQTLAFQGSGRKPKVSEDYVVLDYFRLLDAIEKAFDEASQKGDAYEKIRQYLVREGQEHIKQDIGQKDYKTPRKIALLIISDQFQISERRVEQLIKESPFPRKPVSLP